MRKLIVKLECLFNRGIDIHHKGEYPADVLSNVCNNAFVLDEIPCYCMESFLQALKIEDPNKQKIACSYNGFKARKHSHADWKSKQLLYWKGSAYKRQSKEYRALVERAYKALFEQNERFANALRETGGKTLYHTSGKKIMHETILTQEEFTDILTRLRDTEITH